jgi:hypothetical protein
MKKLLLFTMLLPMMVSAQETVEINGIYYKLSDANKTAVVTKNPHEYSGEIIIPQVVERYGRKYTVTKIDYGTFWLNRGVTSIHMPITIEEIGDKAFINIDLPSLEIPQNVVKIGEWALMYNENINIYCYAKTPPAIGKDVFHKSKNFMLYVPEESLDKYKKADQWKKAKKILPITSVSWAVQQQERYLAEQKRIAEEQERMRIEARQKQIRDSIAKREKQIKDSIEAKEKLNADIAAAENGDIEALLRLGNRFMNGDGVEKDINQAIANYKKAAEKGNVDAQVKLGEIYYYGKDVSIDEKAAKIWLDKAAAKGNERAKAILKKYAIGRDSYWDNRGCWKMAFPNGVIVLPNTDKGAIETNNFIVIVGSDGELLDEDDFVKIATGKKKFESIIRIEVDKSSLDDYRKLTNNQKEALLKKELSAFSTNISARVYTYWNIGTSYGNELDGTFTKGKFQTNNDRYASLVKQFGFDPLDYPRKTIVPGRSVDLINEYAEFCSDNDFKYYRFSLVKDNGTTKVYKLLWNGGKWTGSMWVRNNKVTSVKWLK